MPKTKPVPFYPNDKDGMSCMLSVYASVVDYFLNKKLTRNELMKLTGYKEGRTAWSLYALCNLADMGLDIKVIEPFDYRKYLDEGRDYLKEYFTDEQLEWNEKRSNILDIKKHIPAFLASIHQEIRRPKLEDIDEMLNDGRLVFVTLNSRALEDNPGFASHAILITDKNPVDYIAHDPGLPPIPNRRISREQLWKAMGGDSNKSEVTGFRLKVA